MVPEDSMLRRHYLTELKRKQDAQFENFILVATEGKNSKVDSFPEAESHLPFSHIVVGLAFFCFVVLIL